MINKKIFNFLVISIFIFGCAPKQSAITGDVFLTMGNGSIKPVAGAEVYLFPLEVDLDSSFVDPLKLYINNAKFNISKVEVEAACKEANEAMPNNLDSVREWIIDGVLPIDLELTCKTYTDTVLSLTESINNSTSSANTKSEPILAEIILKEEELQDTNEAIYRLALNQGNILKNKQMSKIGYSVYTATPIYSSADDTKVMANISNNSDYLILSVDFGDVYWNGLSVKGSELEKFVEASDYSWDEFNVSDIFR